MDQTGERKHSTAESAPEDKGMIGRRVALRTLAPDYDPKQHAIYLRHLEEAVKEKKNRNIALTGRYGSGKSSVLDAFVAEHPKSTVRISINTLGPDEDGEDLTNRIQKELVKQLVYRLKPGQLRRSRFARPKPLTMWRALLQALGVTSVGLGLAWLLGARPAGGWPAPDASTTARGARYLLIFALVLVAVWGIRWLVGDRIVSEVTTAGTKIALGDGPKTYFDGFLDEIVAFFDAVEPKYVIFEDLDRFDDPQIFDSLRELNTLINASANWRQKEEPLRFIYAIKDSLFEQLGAKTGTDGNPAPVERSDAKASAKDEQPDVNEDHGSATVEAKPRQDVAAAVVRRANRTKFFELVIPIVPFISHRNARDHLVAVLESLGFAEDDVSRPLVDLVARHTTDMRLMVNICNEFAVFAEHLLWTKNRAPGLTPDHLFALVAYKNFHLEDFEAISQRASTLDILERHHRDEVRALIEYLQAKRRDGMRTEEQRERKEQTAAELGDRLRAIAGLFSPSNGRPYVSVKVDGQSYALDAVDAVAFWEHVAEERSLALVQQYSGSVVTASTDDFARLFPEIIDSPEWRDPDAAGLARLRQQYDDDIATLRGADFAGLTRYERVPKDRVRFDQRINEVLKSQLARDLVRHGFLTRNYAEYSAIFYGKFVGVDVAFFYNHSVQPNEMYLDYQFTSEKAMSNLLEQVPAGFTSSVSALNIQIASYLLLERPVEARELVTYVVTHDSDYVRTFLNAFLNTPDAPRERLIQALAEHPWRDVLEYLASHSGIPDHETRLMLFDAALLNLQQVAFYEIGDGTRTLLKSSYPSLVAVRKPQSSRQTDRVFAILKAVELVVDDLGALAEPLRRRAVEEHMYELTVPNLRRALKIDDTPTLDEMRKAPRVWEFCATRILDYITAMQAEDPSAPIVRTEAVLIDVINEQHESWTRAELSAVIRKSTQTVTDIGEIPQPIWPLVVDEDRMAPTVANIARYTEVHGVDRPLSVLLAPGDADLVELEGVDKVNAEARYALAVQLLNASDYLAARSRVGLADQLDLEYEVDPMELTPSPDQLLARALEAGLVPDDVATFSHFAQGGWAAVSEAFEVSKNISKFMRPALVPGFVPEFLESDRVPEALRRTVVEAISDYIPSDDPRALKAAGRFARDNKMSLPIEDVRRIARVTREPEIVLPHLVSARDLSPSDLRGILASLGEPYSRLVDGPGAEFDLPAGSSNETLLKRLEGAQMVRIVPKRGRRGRMVTVLV